MREILLVEDSDDDRELFKLAFLRSGVHAELTYAADAAGAIIRLNRMGAYQDRPLPDLIVLDLGLPGLRGSTLLDVIRHSLVSKRVAVVVLTGSESESDRIRCEELGIKAFVNKPKTFTALVNFIRTATRYFPTPAPLEARREGDRTPLPEDSPRRQG